MTRRTFCRAAAANAVLTALAPRAGAQDRAKRPNILWIVSEDNSAVHLGCYGNPLARTPNLDRLAAEGVRYDNAFSNGAVCAPCRQTIISGMYASSIGGQHMRSHAVFPAGVVYFPQLLREAGYFCANNSKTDYNGGPDNARSALARTWDQCSNRAHWRDRPDGKPFFAVFNLGQTHESQIMAQRWATRSPETDADAVVLPAYLPDLPVIRRDLAAYTDQHEQMDAAAGAILGDLERDGLADDTIVFYYGDHGGSMPRGKSFIYDSGTRVPLIVRFPQKWKHLAPTQPGGNTNRLVSFVDLAPTLLSLAGVPVPKYMQGSAFLGEQTGAPRGYVHLFRGRRGERYDLVRGVRDRQFLYLRNYTPHYPAMQHNGYAWQIASYGAWGEHWQSGRCTPEQAQFFEPKPGEELYDCLADPDNVRNLAVNPEFASDLSRLRAENDRHLLAVRDSVFWPEGLGDRTYEAFQDDDTYPIAELLALATKVSDRDADALTAFLTAMASRNDCVRYWGAMGCVVLGERAAVAQPELETLLRAGEEVLQIRAADGLLRLGDHKEALSVLTRLAGQGRDIAQLRAWLALDDTRVDTPDLRALLAQSGKVKGYADRVAALIAQRLDVTVE